MKRTLVAGFFLITVSAHPLTQTRPNFSGTWVMDRVRSASAVQAEPISDVTLVVTQTDSELKVTTNRDGKMATATYRLDGGRTKIPNGTATSKWDGATLVTESVCVTTRVTSEIGS